ncbi:endonuclease/exonuclease/phosphatase family protein [Fulvivirga lutimaris]|uniref:endonuclease/exonuclease/phosphatase family protein n=1 Tax=Fulvivirga lutimaris TaxID=1819566 RepID=UPI0012BCE83C|nr:endonuclease/exonuclease/phosphatase family protein [Fulvivirga lutimaris]MTI41444.1 endonuclease/exonuclease/phosphatase family protein [Fulvivirga lutimaris]
MKHYIFTFILTLLTSAIIAQDNISMKVMSYNLKFDDKNDPVNNWDNRKDQVIGLLKYHEPMIFGTQEGLHHQLEDIKAGLSSFEYIGVARDDGKQKGEYSAFFYNTKYFKSIKSGTFWLSETPASPSKSWDAALPRVCSWAEMEDMNTKKHFFIFNTHFDHIGVVAREKSIGVIINKIKELANDLPVVVMGDFNFEDDTAPYKRMTEFMSDTRLVNGVEPYGPEATFNGFHFDKQPEVRIDYIFVNDQIKVKSYATLSDSQDMAYPSDHFPVVAEVEF